MDPENELNSLGDWEAVLEHWKLPFLGTFRSLEGDMREPSWLVFNLVFYFCVLYLWQRTHWSYRLSSARGESILLSL